MIVDHPIRMAILDMNNQVENMGIASIQRIADSFPMVHYQVFDVRAKHEIPSLDFDIYISSGGPGDPLEVDHSWDTAYYGLLDQIYHHNQISEDKKYVFFICHSFQMACHHFRIGDVTLRHKESFGIVPVDRTDIGESDVILNKLNDTFYGADFRKYQVVHPDWKRMEKMGMSVIAMESPEDDVEEELALMAVRFSEEMVGTQFHPEAHPDGMIHYLRKPEKKQMILDRFGLQIYEDMMFNALHPERLTSTRDHILPGFIKDAVDKINAVVTSSPVLV